MTARLRQLTRTQLNIRALLWGGALLASCGTASAMVLLNQDPVVDDGFCLVGRTPPSTTSIVIDATTALSDAQADQVNAVVTEVRDRTPRFGRIMLFLIDSQHPYEPQQRLTLCNPGSPSQLGMILHTPSKAAHRWREKVEQPLDQITKELTHSLSGPSSPILESITGLAWRKDFGPTVQNRELVLVSDLRQFTPADGLSFYQSGAPWKKYSRSTTATAADANLAGMSVRLEVLHRPSTALPEAQLVGFWRTWLKSKGAAHVLIDGVETAPSTATTEASPHGKERS